MKNLNLKVPDAFIVGLREEANEVIERYGKAAEKSNCQCNVESLYDEFTDEEIEGGIKAAAMEIVWGEDDGKTDLTGVRSILIHLLLQKKKRARKSEWADTVYEK